MRTTDTIQEFILINGLAIILIHLREDLGRRFRSALLHRGDRRNSRELLQRNSSVSIGINSIEALDSLFFNLGLRICTGSLSLFLTELAVSVRIECFEN